MNTLTDNERNQLREQSPRHLLAVEGLEGRIAAFRKNLTDDLFAHERRNLEARIAEAEGELSMLVGAIRQVLGSGDQPGEVAATPGAEAVPPAVHMQREIEQIVAKLRRAGTEAEAEMWTLQLWQTETARAALSKAKP